MRDELSFEMRNLVQAARRAEVPADAGVKRRVRHAVSLGIPAGTLLASSLAAASGTAASSATGAAVGTVALGKLSTGLLHGFLVWVAGGFAIGMGATTAYVTWHGSSQPSQLVPSSSVPGATTVASKRRSVFTQKDAPTAPTPVGSGIPQTAIGSAAVMPRVLVGSLVASNVSPNPAGGFTADPSSTAVRQVPSLAEEVALLARVQQKLRDGQGQAALEALDEADRRFAHSQLRPDFHAARVLAWCELGQAARARQVAEAFLRAHVRSPLAERVRQSCAFSATASEPTSSDRSPDESRNGNYP